MNLPSNSLSPFSGPVKSTEKIFNSTLIILFLNYWTLINWRLKSNQKIFEVFLCWFRLKHDLVSEKIAQETTASNKNGHFIRMLKAPIKAGLTQLLRRTQWLYYSKLFALIRLLCTHTTHCQLLQKNENNVFNWKWCFFNNFFIPNNISLLRIQ